MCHRVTSSICCPYLCDNIEKSPECPARLATPLVITTGSQADKGLWSSMIRECKWRVGKLFVLRQHCANATCSGEIRRKQAVLFSAAEEATLRASHSSLGQHQKLLLKISIPHVTLPSGVIWKVFQDFYPLQPAESSFWLMSLSSCNNKHCVYCWPLLRAGWQALRSRSVIQTTNKGLTALLNGVWLLVASFAD